RNPIVEARGEARGGGGEVVAAEHGRIAARLVAAAIGAAPRSPALLEDGHRRRLRLLEHLGISERDVVRQLLLLGREAERGRACPGDAAAAIDERIEHEREELVANLEGNLLDAGGGLAREL